MRNRRYDQADGLRRLLDAAGLRVISVNAAGGSQRTGKNWAIINLASALSEAGRSVLIVDSEGPSNSVTGLLGLRASCGLDAVIRGKRALDDVLVRGPAGILVLPLAQDTCNLGRLPESAQQKLIAQCSRIGIDVDTLLVNAATDLRDDAPLAGTGADELIVVSGGSAAAITSAYALIKRLANRCGRRDFHVLVSEVPTPEAAEKIYRNMARAARRYLDVSIDYLGYVPADERLRQAMQLRMPVVAAFPATPAASCFRSLARAITGWPWHGDREDGFADFMRNFIHASRLTAAVM